jgi:hypothetical protein
MLTRSLGLALTLVLLACGNTDDSRGDGASRPTEAVCTACGACELSLKIESAEHVVGAIAYADYPPAGGDHAACWAAWGLYDAPVPPERWVHNLEHGGVVVLHRCGDADVACAGFEAWLMELAGETPFLLSAPDPAIETRFALLAWGQRLESDCFDAAAFEAFFDKHVDRAPESVTSDPPQGCD